ncbi:MAG: cyclic nucleotide-binding domain-containing protein [Acidobacteria bacterium]|nr:cyclic nucleotide-binding domain-containing protein [Acidobacteriota bacterium]
MGGAVSTAIEPDDLAKIAQRYAEQGMFDEAIHLFEMACKLRPGSVAYKINLNRAIEQRKDVEKIRYRDLREKIAAESARDEIDSAQCSGLAEYYVRKDQTTKAVELLEIAKLKTPNSYRPYELLARLYYSEGEWDIAHQEVRTARKLNPFDRGLAELAGRISFELQQFGSSLENFVDAFLLSTDQKGEQTEPTRRMINTLKKILALDNKQLNETINDRVEALRTNTERLEFRKENLFSSNSKKLLRKITAKISREEERRESTLAVSSQLRALNVFQHMKDEEIFRISRFVRLDKLEPEQYLFHDADRSMDFYVVLDGTLSVQKDTPFGPQILAKLGAGEIIGEMNFIDRTERSSDAVAVASSTCAAFSFTALDQIMGEDKELAAGLHWAFWRSLTVKVRDANEQLKLFFQEDAKTAGRRKVDTTKAEMQAVQVRSEDKVDLFRERGLSAAEMKLLATFSAEERFHSGSMIFREGDAGDKLYIILDGRVRISKFIPGVGEEALAVLGRGDFFGEMALIDEQPRSADAKAHETPATVLSIDRGTLNEILSMDPHASLQFLNLLCRMISGRLREINDKIVQWKYMSGGF